jgi:hypothetical protein
MRIVKKCNTLKIYRDYTGDADENLINLVIFTQEESILQQLQWGVRSLDIRIGNCN